MARPGPDRSTGWRRSTVPVLHLHGDRDVLVPLAAARRMAEGRPDWRLEVARDIGHAPMLEAPVWTGAADRRVAGRRRAAGHAAGGRRPAGAGRPPVDASGQLTWRSSPSQ